MSLLGFLTENRWREPHRGVGTPPSQLTIPGKPILSRDEDLPLATWTEPLPHLPSPINSPSPRPPAINTALLHKWYGAPISFHLRMMELQAGCYPHSVFTWILGIHIPGFMLEPSPEFTNLVSDLIYLLKR